MAHKYFPGRGAAEAAGAVAKEASGTTTLSPALIERERRRKRRRRRRAERRARRRERRRRGSAMAQQPRLAFGVLDPGRGGAGGLGSHHRRVPTSHHHRTFQPDRVG